MEPWHLFLILLWLALPISSKVFHAQVKPKLGTKPCHIKCMSLIRQGLGDIVKSTEGSHEHVTNFMLSFLQPQPLGALLLSRPVWITEMEVQRKKSFLVIE